MTPEQIEGSRIYQREVVDRQGEPFNDVMHQVWDATPWIIAAYTGDINSDRFYEVTEWCRETFGREAWPIGGIEGDWQRGNVTIYGINWVGFKTKSQMNQFINRWGGTDLRGEIHSPRTGGKQMTHALKQSILEEK